MRTIKNGLRLLALLAVVFGVTACDVGGSGTSQSDPEEWAWADALKKRIQSTKRRTN